MSKQVNYNENLCSGAAIRDDKGRRISKLFEASHPKMTVGYAKNLIMPNDPAEQEFNFRQSGGGVIEDGVAVIDKVKGNSVVWNQLIPMMASGTTETLNGVTITYTDNGFLLQGTATKAFRFTSLGTCNLKEGHKYLTFGGSSGTSLQVEQWGGSLIDSRRGQPAIVTISTTPTALGRINIYCLAEQTFVGKELHWQFCDLTQMFGAGNEPTTYDEFLQRKPKVADEYAYNEGTIVNNKVEKTVTTGRNLWDEQIRRGNYDTNTGIFISRSSENYYASVNPIKVLGGKKYYNYTSNTAPTSIIDWYDADMNFIGEEGIPRNARIVTSPSNACFANFWMYMSSGISLGEKCCINLYDPAINGKYFPYEEHALDLSWVKEIKDTEGVKLFKDGMRSAGTVYDEVRKNKAVKRVGVKVFDGTESFTDYLTTYGSFVIMRDAFVGVGSKIGISNRYAVSRLWSSDPDRTKDDKQIYIDSINNRVWIRDSAFADVDSLKQYLAGLYAAGTPLVLYYELAEPIEVEYDEKNLTYPVIAGGTEEAIASEPSTAFRADIGYGIDAVKTILDLKARVEALEGK